MGKANTLFTSARQCLHDDGCQRRDTSLSCQLCFPYFM